MPNNLESTNKSIVGNSYSTQDLEGLQKRVDAANEQLKAFNTTPTTADELRRRAESEYTPLYNAQVGEQEALKRSAQSALDQRLGALGRQYTRDAEELGRAYDTQRVTANNTMLARGLNNSSLAAAMLNRVEDRRNRALNSLGEERTASETAAQNAYSDAVSAADAAIARLGTDRETNIDARYQALKEAEDSRVFQATQAQNALTQYITDLMIQIEKLRQQAYSQYLQQQQLAYEMDQDGSGGGSSSGGGRSRSTSSAEETGTAGKKTSAPSVPLNLNPNSFSNAIASAARQGIVDKNSVAAKGAAQAATTSSAPNYITALTKNMKSVNKLSDAIKKSASTTTTKPGPWNR